MLLLFRHPVVSSSLWPHGLQHARPPCASPSPGVCLHSCSSHWWCRQTISSSDTLFSSCSQSCPASGTFPKSCVFASDDQNTGASASASVLPVNIQGWFPLRLAGSISLLSKGLSASSPGPQLEGIDSLMFCLLYSTALTTIDHWEDYSLDYTDLCRQSNVSTFQHTV